MANQDTFSYVVEKPNDFNQENKAKSIQQQLRDANKEIADLKLQLAWLERPYE